MTAAIPPSLHRLALRTAHALRTRWWRLRRPRIVGCRVLAFDDRDRLLLVRHSYGTGRWMPPGGGLRRGEDPLVAAARELREETGSELEGARQIALVEEPLHGAVNAVYVVAGRCAGVAVPDNREVVEAAFFAADALPDNMAGSLARDLPDWIKAATADRPDAPPHSRRDLPSRRA